MSTNSNCSNRARRSVSRVSAYESIESRICAGQPVPVGVVEQVVDPFEQRRVGHDLPAAVHHRGEFLEGLQAVAALRLGHGGRHPLALGLGQVVGEVGLDAGHVGLGVPDGEVAQRREVAHRAAVGRDGGPHDGGAFLAGEPVLPAGDDQARRQPFDVPLPRAGQRLVEVVDVEHQVAFGRGEQPEVEHVRVPAQLRPDPGLRGRGQVAGHDGRRAAVEPERRLRHPAVPDGDQLLHPLRRLGPDDVDRVRPLGRGLVVGVAFARHLPAGGLAALGPLGRGQVGGGCGFGWGLGWGFGWAHRSTSRLS